MRYRLLTLLAIVTTCAVLFAFLPRPDPFAAELQRDLNLPATSQVWIIRKQTANTAIAVSETNGAYKLFGAYRIQDPEPGTFTRWQFAFKILNLQPGKYEFKLPLSQRSNLKGPDIAQTYDHFPTEAEIEKFLTAHRVAPSHPPTKSDTPH